MVAYNGKSAWRSYESSTCVAETARREFRDDPYKPLIIQCLYNFLPCRACSKHCHFLPFSADLYELAKGVATFTESTGCIGQRAALLRVVADRQHVIEIPTREFIHMLRAAGRNVNADFLQYRYRLGANGTWLRASAFHRETDRPSAICDRAEFPVDGISKSISGLHTTKLRTKFGGLVFTP